jgi:hypothetical protein
MTACRGRGSNPKRCLKLLRTFAANVAPGCGLLGKLAPGGQFAEAAFFGRLSVGVSRRRLLFTMSPPPTQWLPGRRACSRVDEPHHGRCATGPRKQAQKFGAVDELDIAGVRLPSRASRKVSIRGKNRSQRRASGERLEALGAVPVERVDHFRTCVNIDARVPEGVAEEMRPPQGERVFSLVRQSSCRVGRWRGPGFE